MSDPRIFEISRRLTAAQLEERWDPLNRSISQRLGEFAARSIAQSSMAVQAVGQICSAKARAAVQLAWQNIWRSALNVGVEPSGDLATQLKGEIRSQTEEHFRRLRMTLEQRQRSIGVGVDHVFDDLIKARDLALAQVDGEVDLAVASLERRAEREGVKSVYRFYAPVGAVVSGPGASASVVQHIGGQERAELAGALERILQDVARAEELTQEPKEELIELVREARGELDRPKPNRLRLSSVLEAIGYGVQTVGSIQPAYEALKAAAALVGVQLP